MVVNLKNMPAMHTAEAKRLRATKDQEAIDALHRQIEIDRTTFYSMGSVVDIQRYREYAAGRHVRTLTADQALTLEGVLDNTFCDNVCHQILSENADRINLLRWDVADDQVSSWLSDQFTKLSVEGRSVDVHYDCLRDGNAAVMVGWDNDRQMVTLGEEPWWDGQSGVYIGYDAQQRPLYAVLEWWSFEGVRRSVWFEDRLEHYIAGGAGLPFTPYALPSDGEQWPMPWVRQDGSPLHIPVLHFPNAVRGRSNYGTSELAGGVIGFQDQLNDLQYDMAAAGRMTGFQMYWMSGATPPKDANGNTIPPSVSPGEVWWSTDPAARFGHLPAGDIKQLVLLYQTKLKSVSRMTRTPLHSITGGDWPSGEALLRSEMPLVNKATAQISKIAPVWATVAHRMTEIANTFGRAGLNENAMITAVFAEPDKRDLLSRSVVVANVGDTVSEEEKLRILGYAPDQVKQIMEERKTAAAIAPAAAGMVANPAEKPQGISRVDSRVVGDASI